MKFRQEILRNETFPVTVAYQELGTADNILEMAEKSDAFDTDGWRPNPVRGSEASCYSFGPHSIIWAHTPLPKAKWREIVTHEALHATISALCHLGMDIPKDAVVESGCAEEPYCYFQQWILTNLGVFK